ncbi:cytochrome c oxidase assembly factor 1 homolog isoform X1 [Osmerus mordax]|uniref:cytochrome c oxidase assembly factor 1 homolog isoform X1 n=1 Tax=Osmerus mordax TaxID=8014 RepID=UPI00350E95DF
MAKTRSWRLTYAEEESRNDVPLHNVEFLWVVQIELDFEEKPFTVYLEMRVSTNQLQQLAIFTTVFTGGCIGTMYYLIQKEFQNSEYYQLALKKLEANPVAMESLGAPPLKVYNIHLTDRHNQVNHQSAQIKIPVKGGVTGGYLYTSSIRDTDTKSWNLRLAMLHVREGQQINLLAHPEPDSDPPGHTDGFNTDR